MKIYLILMFIVIFAVFNHDKIETYGTDSKPCVYDKSVEYKLNHYFSRHEETPSIVLNNTEEKPNIEESEDEIKLLNYKIKWIKAEKQTQVKIGGELISLKGKKTINPVWNDGKDTLDYIYSWNQIKLYKLADREIIGIRMKYAICSGLSCSIDYFLIYDTKTKSKNFFGTFRTDNELNFYNLGNGEMSYVSKTYLGESDGIAKEVSNIYELYTLDEKGVFNRRKDEKQKTYFLKRTFKADDYAEFDEKFEQNWIKKID